MADLYDIPDEAWIDVVAAVGWDESNELWPVLQKALAAALPVVTADLVAEIQQKDTELDEWRNGTRRLPIDDEIREAPDTDDELLKRVRLAISDPASVLPKDHGDAERPAETTSNWAARAVVASVVAGLRADLDRARRSEYHGEALLGQQVRRADHLAAENERLRAELARVSGARPIPDDADVERHARAVHRSRRQSSYGPTWEALPVAVQRELMADSRAALEAMPATPTTGPAPAAADEPRVWRDRDGQMWGEILDEPFVRLLNQDGTVPRHWNAEKLSRTERVWGPLTLEPAAPQAPAEPKKQCAWWGDTKQCPDWASAGFDLCGTHQREHDRLNEPFAPSVQASAEPTEPMASCGYHTEAEAQRSIRHELCTPAAREDAATQPLPLYEQADLLTWRVVHVPPGTTDREDTDTPITPGWWLVGHGDDPDHPDVQVHLGDRLPTSSAATPAGGSHEVEVTVQDDGWATAECRTCTASIGESAEDTVQDWADRHRADTLRPGSLTPIQPEEA